MPRPSNTLRRAVTLYVNGPQHLRGDWLKCSIAAGAQVELPRNEQAVSLVRKAGGELELAPEPEPEPEQAAQPDAPDIGSLVVAATEGGIPWTELRDKLADTIRSVANGTVKASAAQVSMLKFVIEQAEKQAAQDDATSNVIVLPTQGEWGETRIDDKWRRALKLNEFAEKQP